MGLTLDRLPEPSELARVVRLEGMSVGGGRGSVREPHRHDYHELLWIRCGAGRQRLDGSVEPVRPGSVTLIGRGQVHQFESAVDVHGAVVRFRDELLLGGPGERATPGWLLAGQGARTVPVPPSEAPRLETTIDALASELERPPDGESAELQRHLIAVLLLWVERWYDALRSERRDADDAQVQLHRRFAALLERDFAHQHEAGAYADALGVPAAVLSRALAHVTGRGTKELIVDRAMLEAARLLRFTDLSVQEVAQRTGYADPLYFSRAFKRRTGEAPMTYRERARGAEKSMHP